jgi:hypothetical protein
MSSTNLNNSAETAADVWLAAVKEEVAGLRFGTVQVVVHEGEVVQIERVSGLTSHPNATSRRGAPNLEPSGADPTPEASEMKTSFHETQAIGHRNGHRDQRHRIAGAK